MARDGLYRRGQYWWARDPVTGRRTSTRCRDRQAARAWVAERERLANDPVYAASQHARLGNWIVKLLGTKERKSPATQQVARQKAGHLIRILGADTPLAEIGPVAVDRYVAQRRSESGNGGRRVSDGTIGKELGVLRETLLMAARAGFWGGQLETLRPPGLGGCQARSRALTAAEVNALLGECEGRLAALVAVIVATGARLGEAQRLRPEHIGAEAIHIPGTKTARAAASVPILAPYRPLVELCRGLLPVVYPNNLHRDMAAACARAGIPACTPNDLRRTHITLLREAGVDRDSAKALLRHSPSSNLLDRVYDQSRPEEIARRVEGTLAGLPALAPVQKRHTDDARPQSQASAPVAQRIEQRFPNPTSAPCDSVSLRKDCGANGRERAAAGANGTRTTHTLGALALAMAADRMGVLS